MRIQILIFSSFHSDASKRGYHEGTVSWCPEIWDDLLYNLGNTDVRVSSSAEIFQDPGRKCVFNKILCCPAPVLIVLPLSHSALAGSPGRDGMRQAAEPPPQSGGRLPPAQRPAQRTEPVHVLRATLYETFLLIKINYNHSWTFKKLVQ